MISCEPVTSSGGREGGREGEWEGVREREREFWFFPITMVRVIISLVSSFLKGMEHKLSLIFAISFLPRNVSQLLFSFFFVLLLLSPFLSSLLPLLHVIFLWLSLAVLFIQVILTIKISLCAFA